VSAVSARGGLVRGSSARGSLTLGGEPRVDLLPPEVRLARRGAAARNGLLVLLIVVVVAVVGGTFFLTTLAGAAQGRLETEQAVTADLLAEQSEYIEVRKVGNAITAGEAAIRVGSSAEIDWQSFLQKVAATFPAGSAVTGATIESASPIAAFTQVAGALSEPRIATALLNVKAKSLPDAKAWIDSIFLVDGVSEVSLSSVQSGDGGYDLTLTVAVNDTVLIHQPEKAADAAAPAGTQTNTTTPTGAAQ
jgi:hypothetical protein